MRISPSDMDKFLPNGRCRSCKVGQIDKRSRSPARVTKGNYTKFQTTDRCDRSKTGRKKGQVRLIVADTGLEVVQQLIETVAQVVWSRIGIAAVFLQIVR